MAVPSINLTLDKGTDFSATFNVTNADGTPASLNNYIATAKIRKYPAAPSVQSFSTTITAAIGEIQVSMASSITATLESGRNYYDVIITQGGTNKITKVFEGMILVNDTVSV
jgi:hypothetical protein